MQVFDLRGFPLVFRIFKMLALSNAVAGAILLFDYYVPFIVHEEIIIEKKIKMDMLGDGSALLTFQVITPQHIIDAGDLAYSRLKEQDTILVKYTKVFEQALGFSYWFEGNKYFSGTSFGIYTWSGFMPKFLMVSLFTLLFVNPKPWMVGITLINSVIMFYLVFNHSIFLIIATLISLLLGYLFRKPLSRHWISATSDQ